MQTNSSSQQTKEHSCEANVERNHQHQQLAFLAPFLDVAESQNDILLLTSFGLLAQPAQLFPPPLAQ
jgi:hypothetical protein